MEYTEKHPLMFYIALFVAILLHSILALLLFFYAPSLELEKKTIPFILISNDNIGQNSNLSSMSESENALAAQEFLRTLNESTFEKLIKQNTQKSSQQNLSPSNNDTQSNNENPFFTQPSFNQRNHASNSLKGLQNIFSQHKNKSSTSNPVQQVSTQKLEMLNDYEIKLLQKLAKDGRYDDFHRSWRENSKLRFDIR